MSSLSDLLLQLHCSLHPQGRHYSLDALRHPEKYPDDGYSELPLRFRRACESAFRQMTPRVCFSLNDQCVFSFDTSVLRDTPHSDQHSVLLRNIFVPRPYRGKSLCHTALSMITEVAEKTGVLVLAVVHPFELHTDDPGLETAIHLLQEPNPGFSYSDDRLLHQAMNRRFLNSGFTNFDLSDSLSDAAQEVIPASNQWAYIPSTIDSGFLANIATRMVNDSGNVTGEHQLAA